ncbi:MAG: gamma-glutamylcyclotransferase [Methanosarcinaceae archaeon]|nr:gamma-glutamylcyclotransferase [Methanosarcinaceae archaeon]MDD4748343.1 gamma-glutamylcyclotransferase [Methanosarcinaceae archaeon]
MKTEPKTEILERKDLYGTFFHKNICWERSYKKPAEKELVMALYGSLREGLYNFQRFALPENSEFLGVIRIEGYALYSLGPYPAVYPISGAFVLAEVRKFAGKEQLKTAKSIDYMELFGGYHREYVELLIAGKKLKSVIYVYDEKPETEKVESGDWIEYLKTTVDTKEVPEGFAKRN